MIEIKVKGIDQKLKSILEEYSFWEDQIRRQKRRIKRLKDRQTSISINNDGLPKGTTSRTLADYIVELEDLETDLIVLQRLQTKAYDVIFGLLVRLDDSFEIDVIYQRYINLKSWKTICVEMDRSKTYIMDIHKKALDDLKKVLYFT